MTTTTATNDRRATSPAPARPTTAPAAPAPAAVDPDADAVDLDAAPAAPQDKAATYEKSTKSAEAKAKVETAIAAAGRYMSKADAMDILVELRHVSAADAPALLADLEKRGVLARLVDTAQSDPAAKMALLAFLKNKGIAPETGSTPARGVMTPPATPSLVVDNGTLPASVAKLVKDENASRVGAYTKDFEAYTARLTKYVKEADFGDAAVAMANPVSYNPYPPSLSTEQKRGLPVKDPSKTQLLIAYQGRVDEENGRRAALDVAVKGSATATAPGMGGQVSYDGTQPKAERDVKFTAKPKIAVDTAKIAEPDPTNKLPVSVNGDIAIEDGQLVGTAGGKIGPAGGSVTLDKDGVKSVSASLGKNSISLSRDGSHSVTVDTELVNVQLQDGKLTTKTGIDVDTEVLGHKVTVNANVRTSYDGKTSQAEVGGAVGAGVGEFEAGAELDANLQFSTNDGVARSVKPMPYGIWDLPADMLKKPWAQLTEAQRNDLTSRLGLNEKVWNTQLMAAQRVAGR